MSHGVAARNARVAASYLGVFRLLQLLPDRPWKAFVLNSLASTDWPPINLPPSTVGLTSEIQVTIHPHLGEFDFASHIYRRLQYEPETVSWLQGRQYDTVIEIGANVGFYTLLFSRLFPQATVYSFEPSRKAYGRLLQNLQANDCRNVTPFNCAVASESGFRDFYEPTGHLTNGSLDRSFAAVFAEDVSCTKVATVSGGEIERLCAIGKRVLLKIDVEGAEPEVVTALESLILSSLPDVVIEVLPGVAPALDQMGCLRSYRRLQLTPDGPIPRDTFVSTRHTGRDYALVAIGEIAVRNTNFSLVEHRETLQMAAR